MPGGRPESRSAAGFCSGGEKSRDAFGQFVQHFLVSLFQENGKIDGHRSPQMRRLRPGRPACPARLNTNILARPEPGAMEDGGARERSPFNIFTIGPDGGGSVTKGGKGAISRT